MRVSQKKVIFLGFLIGIERIKIDLEKIYEVLDWSEPRNLKKF